MRETSYSRPLDWQTFGRETVVQDGRPVRARVRLAFGGAHLDGRDPAGQWAADVAVRAALGAVAPLSGMLALALAWVWRRRVSASAWATLNPLPWRTAWWTATGLLMLTGVAVALGARYHVLGTDRTGQDVLVQVLKSVRTAWVIGLLSSVATLPLAVGLGVLAGWCRGWVDAVVQYACAVLQAVPNVLLIAAGVLVVQAHLDRDPDRYATALERADLKVFLLCLVLGGTGWAGLCRLVQAQVRQVGALDFVQAATGLGLEPWRLLVRHVWPQVLPLVLVTTVLDFSALVLYEAVLSFVGLGVDPALDSFGGLLNAARAEWGREPLVWWPMAAACGGMVTLVLAANGLADGLAEAGDGHAAG
jgi:peptide/nickel transport system permease protein